MNFFSILPIKDIGMQNTASIRSLRARLRRKQLVTVRILRFEARVTNTKTLPVIANSKTKA